MILATAVVHTAGINWESVLAITVSVVTVLTALIGVAVKLISTRITGAIDRFRIDVVAQLDSRLTRVETILDSVNRKTDRR